MRFVSVIHSTLGSNMLVIMHILSRMSTVFEWWKDVKPCLFQLSRPELWLEEIS